MKDYTKIIQDFKDNNQINKQYGKQIYYPEKNNEAINTLLRVTQEWFSNQKYIQWIVIVPNKKIKYRIYEFIFTKILILATIIFVIIWVMFYRINNNLSNNWFIYLVVFLIIVFRLKDFFIIDKYSSIEVRIYRDRKSGWTNRYNQNEYEHKYGEHLVLKPFRLPENDNGTFQKMRDKLQEAITNETGFIFEEKSETFLESLQSTKKSWQDFWHNLRRK
ncbi:MAG: hypothetical protein J6W29_07280 [Neisseriaceae bacterium]|nr:hypothetical protein [Neisseriaceae bacterium]